MRKELIISIFVVLACLIVLSLNMNVLATNSFNNLVLTPGNTDNTNNNQTIEIVNGTATPNNVVVNVTTGNTTNTPGELADTGLEDLPWLIFAIFAVSAVFAYEKVKQYKSI